MTVTVRTASPDERARVIDAILLGFASDPFCRWIWPEPREYLEAMAKLIPAFGGAAFEGETAFVTDDLAAAALWLPPGAEPDQEAMQRIVVESVPPERLEEIGTVIALQEEAHPEDKHWYLPLIACDPAHIGSGKGGALMAAALERIDAAGLPAYLESSNPKNVSLYLRHGFEITGEIQHGSSPVMTPMWRPAR